MTITTLKQGIEEVTTATTVTTTNVRHGEDDMNHTDADTHRIAPPFPCPHPALSHQNTSSFSFIVTRTISTPRLRNSMKRSNHHNLYCQQGLTSQSTTTSPTHRPKQQRDHRKLFLQYSFVLFLCNLTVFTIVLCRPSNKPMRSLLLSSNGTPKRLMTALPSSSNAAAVRQNTNSTVHTQSKTKLAIAATSTVSDTLQKKHQQQQFTVKASAFTNMLPDLVGSMAKRTTNGKLRSDAITSDASGNMSATPIIHMFDVYKDEYEMKQRSLRFPSKEQRLKVYLSNWYIPPCASESTSASDSSNYNKNRVQYRYDTDGSLLFLPIHANQTQSIIDDKQVMTTTTIAKKDNKDAITIPNNMIYRLNTKISHERNFILYNEHIMQRCMDQFCIDVNVFLNPSLHRITNTKRNTNTNISFPIILQFGDAEKNKAYAPVLQKDIYSPMVPFLRKYRYSITPANLERVTRIATTTQNTQTDKSLPEQCYSSDQKRMITGTVRNPIPKTQAIITIVSNYQRHFGPLNDVNTVDIAWDKKLDMAVYRGALTGRNKADSKARDVPYCTQIPRCNLVYQHGNSTYVDAKLVPYGKMKYPFTDPLNGIRMFGNSMSMEEMLQYKAIVMLEGNDVSSGLKWALYSNSVVFTQTPTCTSWAMEELLQPWVHYIPINADLSDVEEKVQWMIEHDTEAQTIARNGRLWIADLVYHPDAEKENEEIIDETFQRYRSHFVYNPSLTI